jgi:pimeloyl-ACP methyl ester carboxylesterase
MWASVRGPLSSRFRVIAPDLRGHGESGPSGRVTTVDQMANDVIELLDSLEVTEPIDLGGLSMGGYVALSLAVHHPGRVKRLMLINSRAEADAPAVAANRQSVASQLEETGDSVAFIDSMVARLFARVTVADHPELVSDWRTRMHRVPIGTLAGTLRGLAIRPDRVNDLISIQRPTLVVAGSDDQIVPLAESRRMAELLPDSRLVVIADAGHLAPIENPPEVLAALVNFLDLEE